MADESEELRQRAEQYNHQLLTSEDQYVNELETIVNYIVRPLEKAAIRCKIGGGEDEVKKVFKYLNSMLQFHVTFLSVIRETISVIPDLYKYIGFITMYDDYLNRYDEILSVFATWRSMEFREFITMRLKHKNVKKNIIDRLDSLPWYLYRPFDRIKEYHRFLKDIEKITIKTQDDYNLVTKTLSKIRPLYKKIKQNEDRLQQKTRLLEVQLQIHGYNKPLVENDRFFVYNRQCQMKRRGLPGKKYKHIQIYLFNDLFLWVSARGRFKGSYSFYKENLEISLPVNSKKGDALFSIGLKTEKHKRLIVCADDLQRDKLMNTIIRTYKQCQQKYFKTMNGTNKDLIKNIKRKQIRETNIKDNDVDFSASSVGTINTYNNEPSCSYSDLTDITENGAGSTNNNNNNIHKIQQSNSSNHSHNDISYEQQQHQHQHQQQQQQQYHHHNTLEQISEVKEREYNKENNNNRENIKDRRRWTSHLKDPASSNSNKHREEPSASQQSVESFTIPLNGNGSHNEHNEHNEMNEILNNITPKHQNGNVTPIGRDIIGGNFIGTEKRSITPEPSIPSIEDDKDIDDGPLYNDNNGHILPVMNGDNQQSNSVSITYSVDPINHHHHHHNNNHHHHHDHHNNKQHKKSKKHRDKRGDRKRKHDENGGHISRREQIKNLEDALNALQQQLKIKDDRISDLEESNKTIRQTLLLKDNKIHSLQDEVQHLRMKMSTHSHRAKSISNTMRPPRNKRASSFSIGKGGKITRTAMLPSQLDHNKKIKAMKHNQLHTPHNEHNQNNQHNQHNQLQRAHSENNNNNNNHNNNHRKAYSNNFAPYSNNHHF